MVVEPLFGKLWERQCLCVRECGTMCKCAHLIGAQVWDSVHIRITGYTISCGHIMSYVYVCMTVCDYLGTSVILRAVRVCVHRVWRYCASM